MILGAKSRYSCLVVMVCALAGCRHDPQHEVAKQQSLWDDVRVERLVVAAAEGDVDTVGQLINEGVDVNARGADGMTPLLYCLQKKNWDGYVCLLDHGADPNLVTQHGNSVMHEAAFIRRWFEEAENEDRMWIDLAIKKGGDVNLSNQGNTFAPGQTPLMYAINAKNPVTAEALIAAGADVNRKDDSGNVPIETAILDDEFKIALMLLENGARWRPEDGSSAVDMLKGRIELVFHEHKTHLIPVYRQCVEWMVNQGGLEMEFLDEVDRRAAALGDDKE